MNYSSFPEYIEVRQDELLPDVMDKEATNGYYSRKSYIRVNPASRDEINFLEYVRSDKYYEALKLLSEYLNNKQRLGEIEEKIATFLLET